MSDLYVRESLVVRPMGDSKSLFPRFFALFSDKLCDCVRLEPDFLTLNWRYQRTTNERDGNKRGSPKRSDTVEYHVD